MDSCRHFVTFVHLRLCPSKCTTRLCITDAEDAESTETRCSGCADCHRLSPRPSPRLQAAQAVAGHGLSSPGRCQPLCLWWVTPDHTESNQYSITPYIWPLGYATWAVLVQSQSVFDSSTKHTAAARVALRTIFKVGTKLRMISEETIDSLWGWLSRGDGYVEIG